MDGKRWIELRKKKVANSDPPTHQKKGEMGQKRERGLSCNVRLMNQTCLICWLHCWGICIDYCRPQQIHLINVAQRSQKSVRKCGRCTVEAVTLARAEEPQLPLHAKQMRSGPKPTSQDRTISHFPHLREKKKRAEKKKYNPLLTSVITFLWANVSSLNGACAKLLVLSPCF